MPELTRRRLLTSAGAAATAAFAAEFLPPNVRKALASGPPRGSGRLSDIKHVVILMQENRSFDHYFGMLPGVAGFSDPKAITLPDGKPVWYQPTPTTPPAADPTEYTNPDGYLLPFRLNTLTTSAQAIPSTSHAWNYQHLSWDNGAMDGFVTAHLAANGNNGPYTMGYYTAEDIPFQWALAENFTICDHYHCSVLGPTWPNRLYHWSASIDPQGVAGGPITSNVDPVPYEWKTYPEALTGAGVSWQIYQEVDNYATNLLEMFKSFQSAPVNSTLFQSGMRTFSPGQFEWDAMHDRLPTVSWLIPTSYQSEHPDYTPAAALTSSPARSTRSPPTRTCGPRRCSSSTTTRTTGCSTTSCRPLRHPARRTSSSPFPETPAGRSAAGSGCRASSSRRGPRAAGSPARPLTIRRRCSSSSCSPA